MRNSKDKKHITLKEAAELSGYTPDYLGQLIRSGKLKGEQVFLNTAWMTTEQAVLSYLKQKKKNNSCLEKDGALNIVAQMTKLIFSWNWEKIYTCILRSVIVVTVLFLFFLFFLFSVNFEKKLEMRAEKERLLNADSGIVQ